MSDRTLTDPKVIDGKAFAAKLREKIARQVKQLQSQHGFTPGLAVVMVGEDPASKVYVRNKGEQTAQPAWRASRTGCRPRPRRPSCWR